jgi:hypothetical protein
MAEGLLAEIAGTVEHLIGQAAKAMFGTGSGSGDVDSVRWEGMSNDQLAAAVRQLNSGPGAGAIQQAADALSTIATNLHQIDGTLHTQLQAIGVNWQSQASELAQEMTTAAAAYSGSAGAASGAAAAAVNAQGDAFAAAKNAVPHPSTLTAGNIQTASFLDTAGALLTGHEVDHAQTVAKTNQARQQTIDTMTTYTASSKSGLTAHKPLPPAPGHSVTPKPVDTGAGQITSVAGYVPPSSPTAPVGVSGGSGGGGFTGGSGAGSGGSGGGMPGLPGVGVPGVPGGVSGMPGQPGVGVPGVGVGPEVPGGVGTPGGAGGASGLPGVPGSPMTGLPGVAGGGGVGGGGGGAVRGGMPIGGGSGGGAAVGGGGATGPLAPGPVSGLGAPVSGAGGPGLSAGEIASGAVSGSIVEDAAIGSAIVGGTVGAGVGGASARQDELVRGRQLGEQSGAEPEDARAQAARALAELEGEEAAEAGVSARLSASEDMAPTLLEPAVGGQRGDDDKDHANQYVMEPDELFGDGRMVVPPVLGGDEHGAAGPGDEK